MFTLSIYATLAGVNAIKAELTRTLPEVKSSHRCEAMARGLGFDTYAALRAAIRSPDSMITTAQGAIFVAYLADHGFVVSPRPFYLAIARVAIRKVLVKARKLNRRGIGFGHPMRKASGDWENATEHYAHVMELREELLSDYGVEEFLVSLAFVQRVPFTKTVRPDTSSYRLKHLAERFACTYPEGDKLGPRYVMNGSLIAAAIHAGFKYKTYVDDHGYESLNVNFNMSRRAVDDLDCELRPDGARAQARRSHEERRKHSWFYAA